MSPSPSEEVPMALNRNLVVAGAIVLAAGIGIAAMNGMFGNPPNSGGTIGAAKRYQNGQVAPGDVALGDTRIQAFMQGDVFRRMQTNPEFRKAVEAGLAKALDSGDLSKLVAEGDAFGRVVTDDGFTGLIAK